MISRQLNSAVRLRLGGSCDGANNQGARLRSTRGVGDTFGSTPSVAGKTTQSEKGKTPSQIIAGNSLAPSEYLPALCRKEQGINSSNQSQKDQAKNTSRAVQGFPFIEAAPGHTLPSKGGSEKLCEDLVSVGSRTPDTRPEANNGQWKSGTRTALLSRAESLIQGVCNADRMPTGMRDTIYGKANAVKGNVTRPERFGMAPKAVRHTAVQPICREGI